MHRLLSAVLITSTFGVAGLADQSSTPIVGTWKVVKYEDRGPDGTLSYPYGENPIGYFVYDATGHLSVHIMRTPALKSFPGMREGTGDGAAYREAFLAYAAYFGTYTVDATKGTVTHHVEGSRDATPVWHQDHDLMAFLASL